MKLKKLFNNAVSTVRSLLATPDFSQLQTARSRDDVLSLIDNATLSTDEYKTLTKQAIKGDDFIVLNRLSQAQNLDEKSTGLIIDFATKHNESHLISNLIENQDLTSVAQKKVVKYIDTYPFNADSAKIASQLAQKSELEPKDLPIFQPMRSAFAPSY